MPRYGAGVGSATAADDRAARALRTAASPPFDVVAIAGSAGAIRPLRSLLRCLTPAFGAAVVVVQHRSAGPDLLPRVLAEATTLEVSPAVDGDVLRRGVVHVAPARGTLTVERAGVLHRSGSDRQPCRADALFESAAQVYGKHAIGVVLSGRLDDGARGSLTIKRVGGRVLVQHPETARYPAMPTACLATGAADFAFPVESLVHALLALTTSGLAAELFRVPMPAWAS